MHLITTTQTRAETLAGCAAASVGEWRSIGQVADAIVWRAHQEGASASSKGTGNSRPMATIIQTGMT